ncbi:MAG: DUF1559 domain-containing protein [Pirellulales bacterium]|nr:DUF1559 domain-containing protein [Pirellulales bacterium]
MPIQFTLRTLLVVFILAASALWVGGVVCLVTVLYLTLLTLFLRETIRQKFPVASGFLLIMGLVLPAALILSSFEPSQQSRRRLACAGKMRQLAIALQEYESQWGSFPPVCVKDSEGRPMYSWRVLLLPWLGETTLYNAYRCDEPWDSTYNKKVAAKTPDCFRCYPYRNAKPGMTDYVAVTGPGTMWEEGCECRVKDITDGMSNTVALVEMADSQIPWNAPFDLPLEDALDTDPKSVKTIRSYHLGNTDGPPQPVGHAALVDGTVFFVPGRLAPENFKALVTIAGGEIVDIQNLDALILPEPSPTIPGLWTKLTGVLILIVSFVYLVFRPLPEKWTRSREEADTAETADALPEDNTM